jgi:hypothetical protein
MLARYGPLVIVANADVVTALPRTIRARKSKACDAKTIPIAKAKPTNNVFMAVLPYFPWMHNSTSLSLVL